MKIFLNDKFILLLIVLNGLVIFLNGFKFSNNLELILLWCDNIITILFVVEMIVKLRNFKRDYFKSNWNIFDFSLVILSLPALIAFIVDLEISDYSFLLVFRITRVFKAFRFLKFIPEIDSMLLGVQRALKASIVVIFGFIVYIFIVGIFSFYLFNDYSPHYFSDPMTSLYSNFKIFTVEGWYEIPETVTSKLNESAAFLTYLYFIFILLSGGIFGLSIVNSIFVDAMVSDNNDYLESKVNELDAKIDHLIELQKNKQGE